MLKGRLQFKADGSGFCYYANGRVAACVSKVKDYSSRFCFYADDTRSTPLCAIDELAVGFAIGSDDSRLALSSTGGLLSGADGNLVTEWKWDRDAQRCGKLPDVLEMTLNESMTLVFVSRTEMTVRLKFADGAGERDFEVGLKVKRQGNYLDKSVMSITGKLELKDTDQPTLLERNATAAEKAAEKSMLLHPRSSSLSEGGAKAVVAGLEEAFDGYDAGHKAPREFGSEWRFKAAESTVAELPKIALTGEECGPTHGLGDSIYVSKQNNKARLEEELPYYELKGSYELRCAVMRANPLLERSAVLCAASGRYAEDIIVPSNGQKPSATNPTRKTESGREPLRTVSARELPDMITRQTGLLVVACVRPDERRSRSALAVAEALQGALKRDDDKKHTLVKVDFAASGQELSRCYGVRALPTFLMFADGKLVFRGALGGAKIRANQTASLNFLNVEPNFGDQISTEKMLKKRKIPTAAALDAQEALQRERLSQQQNHRFEVVLVSASLTPEDATILSRHYSGKKVLLCGLAELSGEAGSQRYRRAQWTGKRKSLSLDTELLLPPHLASLVHCCITKPVKANALDDLIDMASADNDKKEHFKGLTKEALFQAMEDAKSAAKKGVFIPTNAATSMSRTYNTASCGSLVSSNSTGSLQRMRRKPNFPAPGLDVTLDSLIHKSFDRSFDLGAAT